jgi:hypothetical protein
MLPDKNRHGYFMLSLKAGPATKLMMEAFVFPECAR